MNRLWTCSQPSRLLLSRLIPSNSCPINPTAAAQRLHSSFASSSLPLAASNNLLLRTAFHQNASSTFASPACLVLSSGRALSSSALNVNTNVAKDVIIFKYDNPRFFKYMNIFAYCQFIFWSYLAHFAYTELRDTPVDEATRADDSVSWWQKLNLGEDRYRVGMTAFSLGVGYIILSLSWLYTLRSVRYLVLRKGGQQVTMVMYGPFGRNRMMDVPVTCISAQESRQTAKVTLPVKLKGSRMFYMLDMRGEFTNTELFDATVGLRRKFDR